MLQIQCETSKSVQTGKFPLEGLLLNLCHMTFSFTPTITLRLGMHLWLNLYLGIRDMPYY